MVNRTMSSPTGLWPGHVIEELLLAVFHNTKKYANNRVECDHGQLKAASG
jgi:transposase-like protein